MHFIMLSLFFSFNKIGAQEKLTKLIIHKKSIKEETENSLKQEEKHKVGCSYS